MNRQENTESIISGLREIIDDQQLRDSQRDVLEQYMFDPEKHQTGVFNLATGFGKTRMMTVLALAYLQKNPNGRIVLVVPSQTLVKDETGGGIPAEMQKYNQMVSSFPLDIGLFYANQKDTDNQIIVTTYSSLEKLRKEIPVEDVGLLLLDEAHHAISDARQSTVRGFTNAATYGMTATPGYDPERDITNLLGKVIAQVDVAKSIIEGDLASCKNIYIASDLNVDLSDVKRFRNDWEEASFYKAIERAIENARSANKANAFDLDAWSDAHRHIAHEIAKFYHSYQDKNPNIGRLCDVTDAEHPNMKKCMINCRSQEEARIQASELNKLFGRMVAAVWTTDTKDKTILDNFVTGTLPVICQVGKLGEGFDMPELDMCINYPTCSRVLEAQRGGRPLRLYTDRNKKKTALVVDLVFGHPDRDNLVEAAHENGQFLYADILGEPVIEEKKEKEEKEERIAQFGSGEEKEGLGIELNGFSVVSGTKELMELYQGASLNESRRAIHAKREGMLTAEDLKRKIVSVKNAFYTAPFRGTKKILEELYKDKTTFIAKDGKNKFLIEKIRNSETKKVEYALHEDPNAFDFFLDYLNKFGSYVKLLDPKKSISIEKLCEKYNIPLVLRFSEVRNFNNFKISSEGNTHYLVCQDTTGELVVENSPTAEKALVDYLITQEKLFEFSDNLEVDTDFFEKYGYLDGFSKDRQQKMLSEVKGTMVRCFRRKKKFHNSTTNTDERLVRLIFNDQGKCCLSLNPNPEAEDAFLDEVEKDNPYLLLSDKREGSTTYDVIADKINLDNSKDIQGIKDALEYLYKENFIYTDSTTKEDKYIVDVVQSLKTESPFALTTSPQIQEKFKQFFTREYNLYKGYQRIKGFWSPDFKTFLKKHQAEFTLPLIREGMKTSWVLARDFHEYDSRPIFMSLRRLYEEGKTFKDSNGNVKPLVEWVKILSSGKESFALHEDPKALQIFAHEHVFSSDSRGSR